jgi:thiosulfate/3-mercaptopyruvate sulfurtransferase
MRPIVTVEELRANKDAVIADVRWYLDGRSGRQAHHDGHIPGAVFVDVDGVLADPPSPALGRHPLPSPERFAADMAALGIANASQVVAYDDAGGAVASRLVWMLRVLGVDAALLDGGIDAWTTPLQTGGVARAPAHFAVRPWPIEHLATIDDVASARGLLIDARGADRYRGEHEPVDPRAGHVPGAVNLPFADNVDDRGRFRTVEELRARFVEAGVDGTRDVIVYCGSGVTACHNALAIEHVGLGQPRLWVGSWSEWSHDRDRPAATAQST